MEKRRVPKLAARRCGLTADAIPEAVKKLTAYEMKLISPTRVFQTIMKLNTLSGGKRHLQGRLKAFKGTMVVLPQGVTNNIRHIMETGDFTAPNVDSTYILVDTLPTKAKKIYRYLANYENVGVRESGVLSITEYKLQMIAAIKALQECGNPFFRKVKLNKDENFLEAAVIEMTPEDDDNYGIYRVW